MRFDMHCHTKEGSIDGKIELASYVASLKRKSFQGMLLTDHNSYRAYRYYKKHRNEPLFQDFIILKGIEYDTLDAGHMIIIMPSSVQLPLLELRGLPVTLLIDIVHAFGGILGPAHPCGEKYMSFCNTRYYQKHPELLKSFDFIETFNACEPIQSNISAKRLALEYDLPGFGGSDAHKVDCTGLGYTDFSEKIFSENALIAYMKQGKHLQSGGIYYHHTTKESIGFFHNLLVCFFWLYNKSACFLRAYKRHAEINRLKRMAEKLP